MKYIVLLLFVLVSCGKANELEDRNIQDEDTVAPYTDEYDDYEWLEYPDEPDTFSYERENETT